MDRFSPDRDDSESQLELRDITKLEFFGDATRMKESFGVLVYGTFDKAAIIDKFTSSIEGSPNQGEYKGHDIYSGDKEGSTLALSVLDDGIAVFGIAEAVQEVIDVVEGDKSGVSGPLRDGLDGLGERLFGLAVDGSAVSSQSEDQPEDLPLPPDFTEAIDLITLAGRVKGELLVFTAVLGFDNEEDATSTHETLTGLKGFLSMVSDDPQTADILSGLTLTQDGKRVTIELELAKSRVADLISEAVPGP